MARGAGRNEARGDIEAYRPGQVGSSATCGPPRSRVAGVEPGETREAVNRSAIMIVEMTLPQTIVGDRAARRSRPRHAARAARSPYDKRDRTVHREVKERAGRR